MSKKARRYIMTEVDSNKCLLYLSKCNYCPNFKMDTTTKMSSCREFLDMNGKKSIISNNIKLINTYTYGGKNGINIPLTTVDIPNWCKLPELATDAIPQNISRINDLYIKSDRYVDFDKNLELIELSKLNFVSSQKNTYNNPNLVNKKNDTSSRKTPTYNTYNNTHTRFLPKHKCSCCGEDKDDVKRLEKNGMCLTCITTFSNDLEKIRFAKLNNFRMKRKANYSEKTFKIVSL